MKNLNWDDLRYFLAVADTGSVTGAARRLDVEHTTVSRRISALEAALGFRLFDRLPRAWNLTPEGENLLPQARRLEDEALSLQRAAVGVAPLSGTVRISAPPVMASHLLVPRLAPLRRSLPGVTLELVGETREANLTRREADIALRLSRPSAEGLVARSLVDIGYGLYGARAYVAQVSAENWEFVGYEESLLGTPQQQWLEKTAGSRAFSFRSNDLGSLHQAVKAGLGIGALPHFLAADDPSLVLLAPDCPVTRTLWLVMHPDVRRSPRVRAIADAIVGLLTEG